MTGVAENSASGVTGEPEPEGIGLGCALSRFEDVDEVRCLLQELPAIYLGGTSTIEPRLQRFTTILDYYQEQPHLLDAELDSLLEIMFGHMQQLEAPPKLVHLVFQYMVLIVKVRGPKTFVRHMPHQAEDVERVLACLERQDAGDHVTWESRYMLLLWLSILVIIPFNMATFDDGSGQPISERILCVTRRYLSATDKCRDAAALLAAKFVTRPDNVARFLPQMIDSALQTCETADAPVCALLGALGCVAAIFKHGRRSDLLPLAAPTLQRLLAADRLLSSTTNVRKLIIKAVQRVGLTFLPQRVASWRYQRGQRSLTTHLGGVSSAAPASQRPPDTDAPRDKPPEKLPPDQTERNKAADEAADEEDGDYDVPEQIDDVLETVLQGLRDKDTVVRWSAAKGVGRITGRLPKTLADEVFDSLMDIFTLRENTPAWHGGCLALAELGRRGLLTLSRLSEVMPVLLRALVYDELQGNYSVGAAIRDAACYVCWAFARAYRPDHFRAHALQVAPALLCVALFDREVNCRRAASAAFQENVGRQGTFPHGIDIITCVDYFAVGNRAHAFTVLSTQVGCYPEYTKPLISHLLEKKINHWDSAIREIASKALHRLTPCDVEYASGYVLDMLRPLCVGIDLNGRHGALLALAEVLHALAEHARQQQLPPDRYIGAATLQFVGSVCDQLERRQLLRGMGGELMRHALCHLVSRAALAQLPLRGTDTIASWQALLDDCLAHKEDPVRAYAVAALPAFTRAYVAAPTAALEPPRQQEAAAAGPSAADASGGGDVTDGAADLVTRYLAQVESDTPTSRRGFTLAVGSLPASLLRGRLQRVLKHLLTCCSVTPPTRLWAECRRDGLLALTDVCVTVGVDADDDGSNHVCAANVDEIVECLLRGLQDYTSDNRGDVGAWVREAAVAGLRRLTLQVAAAAPQLLSAATVAAIFCGLAQQAAEKIDRTRAVAGSALAALLHAEPPVPAVPARDQLLLILPAGVCAALNWGSERETLPRVSRLLQLPVYSGAVLLGLLVSAGGITERLVQTAGEQLQRHVRQLDTDGRRRFLADVVDIMQRHQRQDRVTLAAIRALEPLLNSGLFDELFSDAELGASLATAVRVELQRCADPHKLLAGCELLCTLLQFPAPVQRRCLGQTAVLLCHRFPRIRRAAASALYETLLTHGGLEGVAEPALERAQELLADTDWNQAVAEVRPVRDRLCEELGIPAPQPIKK